MNLATLLLTALALTVVGCASVRPGDAAPDLVGPTWHLVSIGGNAPLASGATLTFAADGRVSGSTGCNRFSGTYEWEHDGDLELSPLATTRMACPPDAVEQERRLLAALADIERAEVEGDRLALRGGAGSLVLVRDDGFGNPGEANTGALPGPEWALAEIRSASGAATVPQGEGRFTVSFLGDGRFTGRADCNRYGGSFEANSDGELVLTNTSTTVAACAPPSSSRAFFGVLNQVVGFEVPAGRLTLRGADGSALMFEREAGWMEPQGTLRDYVYRCESPDGPFTFRIRTGPGEIALWLPPRFEGREGGTYLVLGQVVSASGAKYQDGPVTVWTKGQDYALLEVDGHEFLACPAQN